MFIQHHILYSLLAVTALAATLTRSQQLLQQQISVQSVHINVVLCGNGIALERKRPHPRMCMEVLKQFCVSVTS